MTPRVLFLDNRDSFVFNLVDEFLRLGAAVVTIRSDITLSEMEARVNRFDPDVVVLSPGPGRPEDGGVMVSWLTTRPSLPVLGICLGHQAMALAAGGKVGRAPRPVHGRASAIRLEPDPLFEGLGPTLQAARYHSLIVTERPPEMRPIATLIEDGHELIMALRHRSLPQVGLQFHPESILTPLGGRILARFLEEALRAVSPSAGRTE